MKLKCPDVPDPKGGDIVGCGQVFEQTPDHEGLVDCPHCGVVFSPSREPEAVEYLHLTYHDENRQGTADRPANPEAAIGRLAKCMYEELEFYCPTEGAHETPHEGWLLLSASERCPYYAAVRRMLADPSDLLIALGMPDDDQVLRHVHVRK